jgi:hypothetical protein
MQLNVCFSHIGFDVLYGENSFFTSVVSLSVSLEIPGIGGEAYERNNLYKEQVLPVMTNAVRMTDNLWFL